MYTQANEKLNYHEESQANAIFGYVTEVDGPENGPIYQQIRSFAQNLKRKAEKDQYLRVLAVSGVKNNIVPAIITAINRRWPQELDGRVSDRAKQAAAEMIYEEIITMELRNVYEQEAFLPTEELDRLTQKHTGYSDFRHLTRANPTLRVDYQHTVQDQKEMLLLRRAYKQWTGKEPFPEVSDTRFMYPTTDRFDSGRRMPGSVLDMPAKTIGHQIEARVNAAAKKAGLLGRW